MEEDVLSKVLAVEKEISERIKVEENKADKWLESIKKQIKSETQSAEVAQEETLKHEAEDDEANARIRAESIITDAQNVARKLKTLDSEVIQKLIIKHISMILPDA